MKKLLAASKSFTYMAKWSIFIILFVIMICRAKIRKIMERGKDYFSIVSFTLASRFVISISLIHTLAVSDGTATLPHPSIVIVVRFIGCAL